MKVTQVSATIRFSKEVHEGWKSVELGAEATLEPSDDWHQAQQGLYTSLTAQLRTLWDNNSKSGILGHAPDGPRMAVPPPQEERGPWPPEHLKHHPRHISVRNTRPNLRSLSGTDKPGTHTKRPTALGVGKGRGDD
jgi:hypothetical protein